MATLQENPPSSPYRSTHKIRIVTAASLFDGHDASINIMRRILQSSGAEVIHSGHNRSVHEIVSCAIQEDAQGMAVSSYQGGHMEYFTYMLEPLREHRSGHIHVFGGGGGVITPGEIAELHKRHVARIFSVADGAAMGLQGMINHLLEACDFDPAELPMHEPERRDAWIARSITRIESGKGLREADVVDIDVAVAGATSV